MKLAEVYSPNVMFQRETPLSVLSSGEQGKIIDIDSSKLTMALLKLGISRGDNLKVCNIAPLGGPMAIRVNGTKVLLRKKEASHIWIKPL